MISKRDSLDIQLMLRVGAPKQADTGPECHEPLSVEEKVESCLDLIDSGHESRTEWQYIKQLNNYLMRRDKLSKREEQVLRSIQPIMEKYGQMSPDKTEQKAEYHSVTDK